MSNALLIGIGIVVVVLIYSSVSFYQQIRTSRTLVAHAQPYSLESTDYTTTLLVLGDSTGVGVGATRPLDSVAGQFAQHVGATYVENYSVSGATVADLASQMQHITRQDYTYVLIQIGGNDIIAFHNARAAGDELARMLSQLPTWENLYLLSAGNVGAATLFPRVIRPFHTRLNLRYHDVFETVVTDIGGIYVNLYLPPAEDPFTKEPEVYLAEDGLHPSSAGYKLWFQTIPLP
ncbi:hypothetical protein GW943_01965 [Candidatus Parcubacteria bacterium]|uniref:SGNH hydrolase-type esterase domain-containing protein n=1 Tax=Candidatus Kaiserbacteria bacterium CG10_big_fil_rev_8_21_14_0_10_47_16 TaxID=1974608 RepID=A0A2H0UEI0_9BACT|nr:hypothetical protein [Candidatus Parcubacteria bacterium]PIR84797.1 MAG: hypothetical protein COU16_01260 [Candidatus Kaiserbacteria bacterium CG10_big_fil_rev_8_21_14_0_10_47_16]